MSLALSVWALLQNKTSDIKNEEGMNLPFYETQGKLRPHLVHKLHVTLVHLLHNSIQYVETLQQ